MDRDWLGVIVVLALAVLVGAAVYGVLSLAP
jgi:hypothetical protein